MKKTFKKLSKRAKRAAFATMTENHDLWAKNKINGERTVRRKKIIRKRYKE